MLLKEEKEARKKKNDEQSNRNKHKESNILASEADQQTLPTFYVCAISGPYARVCVSVYVSVCVCVSAWLQAASKVSCHKVGSKTMLSNCGIM